MNNQNQTQKEIEQLKMEGFLGEKTQLPPQNNLSAERQPVQSQHGQEQKTSSQKNNQQDPVSKASVNSNEVTDEMKKIYENVFNSYGADAANNWLKQQIVNSHINLHADNEAVIKEIKEKHAQVYSIPAVQKAINAYIQMDLDPSISLRDQGFHDVMEHMASIYRAGYEDALNLKNQNDSAKARMGSAVNSAVPHQQSNKIFTRSDIKSMSPDVFVRNEKAIFEQLGRGLIK